MAKAFTESNKEDIRTALLNKGREYFIKYGYKKTSVDEIVKAVGIAKGSFYKFFDSKEALFMAIHEESETNLQIAMMQKLEKIIDPSEKLRMFFQNAFHLLETDPLLRAVLTRDDFESLSGFMTSDKYREHYRNDIAFLEELIKKWQEEGVIRKLDATVASNMIAAAYYIIIQKESFNENMYKSVIDMLVDSLVHYLKADGR